jgi:hypothetical protein
MSKLLKNKLQEKMLKASAKREFLFRSRFPFFVVSLFKFLIVFFHLLGYCRISFD